MAHKKATCVSALDTQRRKHTHTPEIEKKFTKMIIILFVNHKIYSYKLLGDDLETQTDKRNQNESKPATTTTAKKSVCLVKFITN